MNSLTCMRTSWSSNLAFLLTIDELARQMPQGRNPRQMLREPSRLCKYVLIKNALIKKKSNIGASLPGFYLLTSDTVTHHTLSNSGQNLPARQLTFSTLWLESLTHPGCELSISRRMSARASRPRNLNFFVFTCPTQRVSISRRTPARCSRPDNLTFSSLLLCEAYPSDTVSLDLPSDAGEVLPARQPYLFHPAAGETYHPDCEYLPSVGCRREPHDHAVVSLEGMYGTFKQK